MRHLLSAGLAGLMIFAAPLAVAQKKTPTEWDGLSKVESKKFDAAYLAPGTDFKAYTKVMLDPTEAAFRKNWQRDWNSSHIDLEQRISDEEARKILSAAQTGVQEVFTKSYQEGGYQVVTAPGPDVLRIKTYIINLDVTAPDLQTASRTRTFSSDAGSGVLVLEARDSMSGALLGRGVDKRELGDSDWMMRRSSVSNRADFERGFKTWGKMSVDALNNLKAMAPVAVAQN
jgi:hypothetical protein